MEVLDRPPVDVEAPDGLDETTEPDAPSQSRDDESQTPLSFDEPEESSGYAMKFGRRKKIKSAAAIAAERKAARAALVKKKARARFAWLVGSIAVPGLILVGVLTVLGEGAGERVQLPKEMPPSSFAGLLDFSATERVGTLFQATLRSAPSAEPVAYADFRSRLDTIASTVAAEGYESILVMGPDGTTFASGGVRSVTFAAPGATGT